MVAFSCLNELFFLVMMNFRAMNLASDEINVSDKNETVVMSN